MAFKIEISTSNAAFEEDYRGAVVADLLTESVAPKLRDGHTDGIVRDVNGNNIGTWTLTTE